MKRLISITLSLMMLIATFPLTSNAAITYTEEVWNADQKISVNQGSLYAGIDYVFGKAGEAVDTTSTLGTNIVLGDSYNGNAYFKWDISDYSDVEVAYAHIKFITDSNSFDVYTLPASAWNTTTAPTLTNATKIDKVVSEVGDLYADYTSGSSTRRARNLNITSVVNAAKLAGDDEVVIVIAPQSGKTVYLFDLNNADRKPALQVEAIKSIRTEAFFTGTIAAGETLTLYYSVANGWDEELSGDCYLAVYDNFGDRLYDVAIASFDDVTSGTTASGQLTLTIPGDAGDLTGYTAKAMIWDDNMSPFIEAIPLTVIGE